MNKAIIQQLLDAEETRCLIADTFGQLVDDAVGDELGYDDLMLAALNKLNDEPVVGDVITIEVSDHMWVRGEYLRTLPDGRVVVNVIVGIGKKLYKGKRIKLERSETSE